MDGEATIVAPTAQKREHGPHRLGNPGNVGLNRHKGGKVMFSHKFFAAALAAAVTAFSASYAIADEFSARLSGFEELGALNNQTGAILSNGTGTLKLDLNRKTKTINYTLTYSNVGTTPPKTGAVSQAHIHFGKVHDSGGIIVFLCTNLGNGPAAAPPPSCPVNSGTVTGTITAASVVAIATQNVDAMDFDALQDALVFDTAYANIHTTAFPAGEIRGQVRRAEEEEKQKEKQER